MRQKMSTNLNESLGITFDQRKVLHFVIEIRKRVVQHDLQSSFSCFLNFVNTSNKNRFIDSFG